MELIIINKMKKKIKTIYIAGAVTSDINENGYLHCYQKFENAEKTVAKYFPGAKIYNPMKICKADWGWVRCMVVCLWVLIKKCDTAIFLDDYKTSKGAMIEFKVAIKFEKEIKMIGQLIGIPGGVISVGAETHLEQIQRATANAHKYLSPEGHIIIGDPKILKLIINKQNEKNN